MSAPEEMLVGDRGGDHVAIYAIKYGHEDWLHAKVRVACGGWNGGFNASFMKGEFGKLAEELRSLHSNLAAYVDFEPTESYIKLSFSRDGKGHVRINGRAYSPFSVDTELSFAFNIDQTFLKGIINALLTIESGWKVPT